MSDTKQIDDGGPAYPVPDTYHPNGQVQFGSNGISARDLFAGHALGALIVDPSRADQSREEGARLAYAIADAMLKARAKR